MLKSIIKIIHELRVFLFAFILVSFLYNLGINPVSFSRMIGSKLGGAVGITTSTSVEENPVNLAAKQLKEKEEYLNSKERELDKREGELAGPFGQKALISFMSFGIGFLFLLILLNYYFDYKRRKNNEKKRF